METTVLFTAHVQTQITPVYNFRFSDVLCSDRRSFFSGSFFSSLQLFISCGRKDAPVLHSVQFIYILVALDR